MTMKNALCWLGILAGVVLIYSQLTTETPWQFGVLLGAALIVAGGGILTENPPRRRNE